MISTHLPPPVMTDSTAVLACDHPHVVLQLRHVFFGRRFLGERPGQHELGFEHRTAALDPAVEGGRHPAERRMPDPTLDVGDDLPGIGLVPAPVKLLGHDAKLKAVDRSLTVSSEKKIAANRRNAQKSTGPRSSAGKRRTSSNAYRHGLTAGVTSSAKDAERIERLAREIAGSATDVLTLEYARDAAQAELDLAQIRRVKIALIERMSAFGEFRARGFDLQREIKLFFRGRVGGD